MKFNVVVDDKTVVTFDSGFSAKRNLAGWSIREMFLIILKWKKDLSRNDKISQHKNLIRYNK